MILYTINILYIIVLGINTVCDVMSEALRLERWWLRRYMKTEISTPDSQLSAKTALQF